MQVYFYSLRASGSKGASVMATALTCCTCSGSQFHSERSNITAPTQTRDEALPPSLGKGNASTKMGTATSRDNWLKHDAGAPFKSQDLSNTALKIALLSISSRELRITSPNAPQSLTGTTCSNNFSGECEAIVCAARQRERHYKI
jgi:hypothetical protein